MLLPSSGTRLLMSQMVMFDLAVSYANSLGVKNHMRASNLSFNKQTLFSLFQYTILVGILKILL